MPAMRAQSVDIGQQLSPADYAKAVLNILEDSAAERTRLQDAQKAVVNILEDSAGERTLLATTQKAVLNILEDSGTEKLRLEEIQKAVLNILDDFAGEVDKRRQAQTSLLQLNAELEAFSYSVSHDLRAPLRAIDGFGQRLIEASRDKLDSTALHYLDRIRAGTQIMAQLIEDLLSLSRVSRAELNIQPVSLSTLVQRIANELRQSEPGRSVAWSIAGDAAVVGDERLLGIVLRNLLGNAWKFTSKCVKACVEFGETHEDGETVYFVRDNGAGFDMAYTDKLFAPFQRLHSAAEFFGTGIGLATVRRIVQRHGGRVWAKGAVDQGATFYFTLGKGAGHDIKTDIAG